MSGTKKNLFLTGASGFIGKYLIQALDKEQYNIFALCRKKPQGSKSDDKGITWLEGEMTSLAVHRDIIRKCEYIAHMAGETKNETVMEEANVSATRELLSQVKNGVCKHFLYLSSSGVFGLYSQPQIRIDETSLCYPDNLYEKTKLRAEQLVKESGIPFLILRPSNVVGIGDKDKKLLNLFRTLKRNRFWFVNKSAMLNYVSARHLGKVMAECLNLEHFSGDTFIVNAPCRIETFINTSAQALGITHTVKTVPLLLKPMLWLASKVLELLPRKFQVINSNKWRELTNERYYATDKLRSVSALDPEKELFLCIRELVSGYQSEKLL
ncbi:MAG: NAD-dependent epimerase/dehydratase family protein [Bacteroidia bacterium]